MFFSGWGHWFYYHQSSDSTYEIVTDCARVAIPRSGNASKFVPTETVGYFHLSRSNELYYNEMMTIPEGAALYPSPDYHPGSTVHEVTDNFQMGGSYVDFEDCYFEIDESLPYVLKANDTTKPVEDTGHKQVILTEGQLNKIQSLKNFIAHFSTARKKIEPDFNPLFMKCFQDDLLIALKKWAKKRDEETQKLWDIKKLSNLDIWSLKERKEICGILTQGQQSKREEDYFKIVNF